MVKMQVMNGRGLKPPVVLNQPNSINAEDKEVDEDEPITHGYVDVSKQNHSAFPNHLKHLCSADRVIIRQNKARLGVILGCETENRYDILNEQNKVVYMVDESSDFCMRFWCGPLRPIMVTIMDMDGSPLIYLERALACQDACFPCCLQSMTVESPVGRSLGYIEQKLRLRPELHIKNENGQTDFIVKGPLFQFSCKCGEVEFPIFASDGVSECGRISRRWRGILHEGSKGEAIFGVKFPPGINPWSKALLIGATFLVNYIYYEETHHG